MYSLNDSQKARGRTMAATKADVLFLLAGILQSIAGILAGEMVLTYEEDYGNHSISINGSYEDYFFYEDYYNVNSTYDYTNISSVDYPQNESRREKEVTLGNAAGVLLLCRWILCFTALPHFLFFLQEALSMSLNEI